MSFYLMNKGFRFVSLELLEWDKFGYPEYIYSVNLRTTGPYKGWNER